MITVHLHDNLGSEVADEKYKKMGYKNTYPAGEVKTYNPDMHTLNKYGNINWEEVAKRLATIKRPINLDYEVLMCYRKNETPQEVLKEVYKQACKLEKLIESNKKTK